MPVNDHTTAIARIVSAIIAKGFEKDTDGCDMLFEEGDIHLVDTHGHRMSLRAVVEVVRRSLE